MRIVHAADTHLDSPLRGLSRLEDDDVATPDRGRLPAEIVEAYLGAHR
jgi:hypothetical protein